MLIASVPSLLADLRYAARTLRRSPSFAAGAIVTLSLGIATNTAIFSVVNKVLLEPLPYPEPDRLVQLMTESELGNQTVVSIPKYLIWRGYVKLFQYLAAFDTAAPNVNLTDGEFPRPVETARVSADYFRLFGIEISHGRDFTREDDIPGAPCVALISHSLWRTRFHAGGIEGQTLPLDHQTCKVIGVLPSEVRAENAADLWLPLQARSVADHMGRVRVIGRLLRGVTLKSAQNELRNSKVRFLHEYPYAPLLFGELFVAVPLRDAIVGDVRTPLLMLTGAVAFVLLIACANVGSLVLARATRRARDIAVRSALGASRRELIRQLLAENMLIALISSVLGLLLGVTGVRALLASSPAGLPRIGANGSAIGLDLRVFLFTLGVSVVSGLVFGLVPALKASKANLLSLVNETPLESGMGFRRHRERAALVVSQVALALVLLAGAGLLIRTFVATRTTNRGFDESNVVTIQMSLAGPQFERTAQVAELVRKVERDLKKIRGVSAIASTSSLPVEQSVSMPFSIVRHDQTLAGRYHGAASWRGISPQYFGALRIRLLRGRDFTGDDNEHGARVVIINRMMWRKYWQDVNENPIGEYIIAGKDMGAGLEDLPRQVIGVVDDIREAGLAREPMMYIPVSQFPNGVTARNNRLLPITWLVRTNGASVSQGQIERDLSNVTGLPLGKVRTMQQVVEGSFARTRFYTLLLSVFGALALFLAAVGLYGIMAFSVQQRTREIGLRMALGAEQSDIRNMIAWQGMRLVLLGIGMGIPAALAVTRLMENQIFGVKPWDPEVLSGVAMLLLGVAALAIYLPSMRATAVSPCESLRR